MRRVADNEYEISVRHDTNNPRQRLWFYFKAQNARAGQRVLIHIVNFSKTKSLYRDGMSPLVRTASSPTWERINPKSLFYYKQKDRPTKKQDDSGRGSPGPDGGRDSPEDGEGGRKTPCVLSIVYTFERKEAHWFSYSYPFGYTMQQHLLDALERKKLPYVKRELLCRTLQNRRCDVLTIGEDVNVNLNDGDNARDETEAAGEAQGDAPRSPSEKPAESPPTHRSVVMITCRVHPGETPCSHTLRGFIDFVTGDSAMAVKLRKRVTFVLVPMLNPDGCALGNYRTDSTGVDLNRAWRNADNETKGDWVGTGTFAEHKAAEQKTARFPTLRHAMALARKYASSATHSLEFYIDIHAHSTSKSSFFFVNDPHDDEDVGAWERVAALPKLMDHNCAQLDAPGFSLSACRFCSNPDKAGTGRRAVGDMARAAHIKRMGDKSRPAGQDSDERLAADKSTPETMCYTLEMSFYNAPSRARQWSPATSNEDSYERHGVGLAHAFVDYYRLRPPTEQRVEGILRRMDNAAKVAAGSDQAAAWTKGDLMFGFGTQIFADGGASNKVWNKNGAREARAALNAREPSFTRWLSVRSQTLAPKNVSAPPVSPTPSTANKTSKKTLGSAEKTSPRGGGKKATSVGKHRRNGSPAAASGKKETPGSEKPGKESKSSPGIVPTAFEFVAIPTAPSPTCDANLAGKKGVGRAKLRSRMRNVSSPPPPEDTGEASVANEEDFPVEREEAPPGIAAADPAFWIPTGVPSRPHSSDVVGTGGSEGLYGLAADMARARVDAGAFGLATFAESTGPLFGATFSEQNGSSGGSISGEGAARRSRPPPKPAPPPLYPWEEEDDDGFGDALVAARRLRSA